MEEIILCDIDGTVANIDHRRPHVMGKKKDFESFYAKQEKDLVKLPTLAVLNGLCRNGKYGLLFVSGRPEKYRFVTELWLASHCDIYMKNSVLDGRINLLKARHKSRNEEPWLKDWNYNYECLGLLMRPDDDNRSDAIVKEEIYLNQIKPHYSVFMVLDDRNKVVEMWREHGLVCHQVADGNF